MSTRRGFFGRVFGGLLVAVGVKVRPRLLTFHPDHGWREAFSSRPIHPDYFSLSWPALKGDVTITRRTIR